MGDDNDHFQVPPLRSRPVSIVSPEMVSTEAERELLSYLREPSTRTAIRLAAGTATTDVILRLVELLRRVEALDG